MEIQRLLAKNHQHTKNPQKAFDADMAGMVKKQKTEGNPVLLLLDANTPINSPEMKRFMKQTGLKNVFTALHPMTPPPSTYDRGTACLDMALACEEGLKLIKCVGYLPFYALGPDDHRALFIDLYIEKLRHSGCEEDTT